MATKALKKRARVSKADSSKDKRALFVEAYLTNGRNATKAAISAGYSAKTAGSAGNRLLKNVEVAAQIQQRGTETLEAAKAITGLTVERTLREVARLAYFDPRKLYTPEGQLKKIHELDDDTAAAIASVEVDEIGVEGLVIGLTKKIKHWDKNSALEKAMKHLGQYEADNEQQPPATVIHAAGLKSIKFEPLKARARTAR